MDLIFELHIIMQQTHDANVITKSLKDLKNKGEKRKFQVNLVKKKLYCTLEIRAFCSEDLCVSSSIASSQWLD